MFDNLLLGKSTSSSIETSGIVTEDLKIADEEAPNLIEEEPQCIIELNEDTKGDITLALLRYSSKLYMGFSVKSSAQLCEVQASQCSDSLYCYKSQFRLHLYLNHRLDMWLRYQLNISWSSVNC